MKNWGRIIGFWLALATAAAPALAEIQDTTVTAERREESLQDVPLAVSAFGVGQIENLQINMMRDIGENVPNMQTYTAVAGAEALQIHARGASIHNPGLNTSESPVAIFEDDIYRGRLASANLNLLDVERIEVLRGPQGTLYGRNTIAGAIRIITRTPGDDPWFTGSLGLGNYDTIKVGGSVGGPLAAGSLAGSLAFVYDDRSDGWQTNPITEDDPGEYDNKVFRGKLRWYGDENFDATLSVWGVDVENDGYNGVPYTPFVVAGTGWGSPVGEFYDNYSPAGANYGSTDQTGVNLTWSYAFSGVTLKSITGYADIDDEFGFDNAGGGASSFSLFPSADPGTPGLLVTSDSDLDHWSQEFQLLGDAFGDRLDWILGLSYLNEDGSQTYGVANVANISAFTDSETDSYAVFTEGTWRFADRWSTTLGLRWTRDEKEHQNACEGLLCAAGLTSKDFDETTPKVSLAFEISDDQSTYLSYARGFQAARFQTRCFGSLSVECAGEFYDPQTVDSIELGYKGDLFNRRLRLNAAAFYAAYDDFQPSEIPGLPSRTGNPAEGSEVDVYGAEVEVVWSPADSVNIFGMLGFQESDYDTLAPPFPAQSDPDELLSNPEFTAKVGFDYTIPLPDELEFFYGADIQYTDEYLSVGLKVLQVDGNLEVINGLPIDDYVRLNGFVGIGRPEGQWQIVLSARNITDEEDNVAGVYFPGLSNVRTPLPPVEYMLTFRMNY